MPQPQCAWAGSTAECTTTQITHGGTVSIPGVLSRHLAAPTQRLPAMSVAQLVLTLTGLCLLLLGGDLLLYGRGLGSQRLEVDVRSTILPDIQQRILSKGKRREASDSACIAWGHAREWRWDRASAPARLY